MLPLVEAQARLIGVNHVALEVGDVEAALAVYGRLFRFELRGRVPGAAFIDMGDQFIALMEGRRQAPDDERHFGLVVDDVAAVRAATADSAYAAHLAFEPGGQVELSLPCADGPATIAARSADRPQTICGRPI